MRATRRSEKRRSQEQKYDRVAITGQIWRRAAPETNGSAAISERPRSTLNAQPSVMQSLAILLLPLLSFLSAHTVSAATLPSSIVLLVPPNPTYANEKWSYGVDDSNLKTYGGYLRNVSFYLTLPNGTTSYSGSVGSVNVSGPPHVSDCPLYPGGKYTFNQLNSTAGDYTVMANVTYAVGANGSCVAPFNFTSEIITDTFTQV
ncbi:hypothetical protein MNV49_002007 [Pseudohyphozyma bogoriensis]|nr:hypothetical protein MNV49_002007 [Pseudohyphozyma bogoriensis]